MKVAISNNGLTFDGTRDRMVSGSVGTASCTFVLGDEHDLWDGLAINAVWRNGTVVIEQAVEDGGTVTVPHEVLADPGELYVGVYGAKADGTVVRPELWVDVGQVLAGVPVGSARPSDPTLDAYQEAYLKVRDVVGHELSREQAEETRAAAESARAAAEEARATAEARRQSDSQTATSAANAAAGTASAAAVKADTATAGANEAASAANSAASAASAAKASADAATAAANKAATSASDAATSASAATDSAASAAKDALAAAEEARGSVSADRKIYLTFDNVGGTDYLSLVDTEE